jgi:phosphoglucan, water dikinase
MVSIGNQTSFAAARLLDPFEFALANDFRAFEWFPDRNSGKGWEGRDLTEAQREQLRDTARERGVRFSVHARLQANPLETSAYFLLWEDLELARDLGARLMNLHLVQEQGIPAYLAALHPLLQRTVEAGLELSIENTPADSPELFNQLFEELHSLGSLPTDQVGMCLDLGHANLCSATRNRYLDFLDRLDPHVPITHVHLHENWGDRDAHLPLFTGPAAHDDTGIRGLIERLRQRRFAGSLILEQWPEPPALLTLARDRLARLLEQIPTPEAGSADPVVAVSPPVVAAAGAAGSEEFAVANQRCRSWREKLEWVYRRLAHPASPLTLEQLVDVSIYLRFLSSGQIPCVEDGRHFRPAHHARLSQQIQERLARLSAPDLAVVVRRIYPWLPSSSANFQRPEPLTRIRDIAHRNDIPSELKHEIKHTLQNKLHRCAGPEDLGTSAAILERITRPGASYSPEFVQQFILFHEELKEFFNARSLESLLESVRSHIGAPDAELVTVFLEHKRGGTFASELATLAALTTLRSALLGRLAQGRVAWCQELVLAEIALEDYAFVLLSRMQNDLAAPATDPAWGPWFDTIVLAVENLRQSDVEPEESQAIEQEFRAWRQGFNPSQAEQLLRLKATVERTHRLTEGFSSRVLALFAERVERLGRALGVADQVIRTFGEAQVRGHVVFQVSKLASLGLHWLREALHAPAWDVVVSGQTTGRVETARALGDFATARSLPTILLLETVAGDEDIPPGVSGLVLAQELPHLSHFAIRARQNGVVLAACEEVEEWDRLRGCLGTTITLTATPEEVRWQAGGTPSPPPARASAVHGIPIRLTSEADCLPLTQIELATGGGKAWGVRRLAELAASQEAGFRVPPALVIPFGVLEDLLRSHPQLEAEYERRSEELRSGPMDTLAAGAQRQRELIEQVEVPKRISALIAREWGRQSRLMVRSSASCEDLALLAGAGLYESVANVACSEVNRAIRRVWASLWTDRAVRSRRLVGLAPGEARMAVLIQPLLAPDFAFVLHTANPLSGNQAELYAEVAVGLGEAIASAASRGSPYRWVTDKHVGQTRVLSFANLSQALRPAGAGGIERETISYAQVALSVQAEVRHRLASRLAHVAQFVEHAFGVPQDIEGAVVGQEIYLLQSRPQQGLEAAERHEAPASSTADSSS